MQQDVATNRPAPRTCPWCISTNTFAAQRCIFCGMDLGVELRTARAVQPQPAATAQAALDTRAPHQWLRWMVVSVIALFVVGVLVLIEILQKTHWL
jgi:hypothetical protein